MNPVAEAGMSKTALATAASTTAHSVRLLVVAGVLLVVVQVFSPVAAHAQRVSLEKVVMFTPDPEPTEDVAVLHRRVSLRPVPPLRTAAKAAGGEESDSVVVASTLVPSESLSGERVEGPTRALQATGLTPIGPDVVSAPVGAPEAVRPVRGARVGKTSLSRVENRAMTQRVPQVVLLPNRTQQLGAERAPRRAAQTHGLSQRQYDVPTSGQRHVRVIDGNGPTVVDLGVTRHTYAANSDGGRRVGGLYRLTERIPELTQGTKGDAVRQLQVELVRSGIPLEVDGVYGANTVAAIRTLQRRMNAAGFGLRVDGIYGPMTHAAWLRYRAMRGGQVVR